MSMCRYLDIDGKLLFTRIESDHIVHICQTVNKFADRIGILLHSDRLILMKLRPEPIIPGRRYEQNSNEQKNADTIDSNRNQLKTKNMYSVRN